MAPNGWATHEAKWKFATVPSHLCLTLFIGHFVFLLFCFLKPHSLSLALFFLLFCWPWLSKLLSMRRLSLPLINEETLFSSQLPDDANGISFETWPESSLTKKIRVAICVHGVGSCRVGSYISTIWVNPNTTRLLIVSWYVNPNTTCLLNGLTRHDLHNPFNKWVGLGWHDPTWPIWVELHKLTYTTHLTRITQIDLYSPFNPNSTNWLV